MDNQLIIIAIQLELFELKLQINDSILDGSMLNSILDQIKKLEDLILQLK